MFLCDRGRFGYAFVNAPERIRSARVAWRPVSMTADASQAPVAVRRERALDAAASLLRGRRVLGIGSPRASLEANYALRTLVGAERFYLGMSDTDYDLVGAVLEIGRAGSPRLGALADVQHADAVFILGEDVTNTAPLLDLTVRTWLRLRPTAEEKRVHISRWNDAAIGRAKRREPRPLWIATPDATKLDEVAGETWRAAPADIARRGPRAGSGGGRGHRLERRRARSRHSLGGRAARRPAPADRVWYHERLRSRAASRCGARGGRRRRPGPHGVRVEQRRAAHARRRPPAAGHRGRRSRGGRRRRDSRQ
jgi:NADH dehydrogenase/NADH:ubiquinone oxidoreductase subunit G